MAIGHTTREMKHSVSLMSPSIYACLASNISAMAIKNPNPKIRDFLFLGSFTYFVKVDLPGRLKLILVMYAADLYTDCEWWIDQFDDENIKYIPSFCLCRIIINDILLSEKNIINTSQKHLSTCVSFLPTELSITPAALKYEMFRFYGVSLDRLEKTVSYARWHYRAIVDSNIYFFFAEVFNKKKTRKVPRVYGSLHKYNLLFARNKCETS